MPGDFSPYGKEDWRLLPTGSVIHAGDVLHVEPGRSSWIRVEEGDSLRGVPFIGRKLEHWNPLVFRMKTPDETHLKWNLENERCSAT